MLLLRVTAPVLDTHAYVVADAAGGHAVVVDPGAGAAPAVRDLLTRHRLTLGAVVVTHGHADHVWDAAAVAGEEVPVHVATPDAYRLDDPARALGPQLGAYVTQVAPTPWRRPARVEPLPPACLSGGGAALVPGVVVRGIPAPGHTEGSTVLLVRGTVEPTDLLPDGATAGPDGQHLIALCGDVFFAGSVGRTDLPGGDEQEMAETLRTLARSLPPETVLLPGHGPGTVLEREISSNPHLRAALTRR
ncbi:MBL fold metallo-hydrolase [Georgenia yuyongxinii]